MITGPTFEEMLHPNKIAPAIREGSLKALKGDPLNPINLFNITWRNAQNEVNYIVLPPELTGVEPNIVVLYGKEFPSGSHKVGAAYSVLLEKELFGEVDPSKNTLSVAFNGQLRDRWSMGRWTHGLQECGGTARRYEPRTF